jgi:hypothetical protein
MLGLPCDFGDRLLNFLALEFASHGVETDTFDLGHERAISIH